MSAATPSGSRRLRRGSLVVVGTGITGLGQLTLEAVASIRGAEQLYYAVTEPTTELWLKSVNRSATSLASFYAEGKRRDKTYAEVTRTLVAAVRGGANVCAAFYGHPGMLVEASHTAIRRLRRGGYPARMLPGVSSDGCLIADLGLNPGDRGLQSFEATDFLLSRRRFDPTSPLLLWQVGVLGETTSCHGASCRPERLATLARALGRHYPPSHRVILYYAATFPTHPPLVRRVRLAALPTARVRPTALLCIPPLPPRPPDPAIQRWLGEA